MGILGPVPDADVGRRPSAFARTRESFNAVRYVVKTGSQWRSLPHDFPDWWVPYQQVRGWMRAGVFERIVHDLRVIHRLVLERNPQPSAAILDGRTLQSTPASGSRVGFDGHKMKKGSKVHIAVDTLGNLLALKVTLANEQERTQSGDLAAKIQEVTGNNLELAFVNQGYADEAAAAQASAHGIR